jgi:hypothetical protein
MGRAERPPQWSEEIAEPLPLDGKDRSRSNVSAWMPSTARSGAKDIWIQLRTLLRSEDSFMKTYVGFVDRDWIHLLKRAGTSCLSDLVKPLRATRYFRY